ncbi:hypothetical protein BDR03DRAFT_1017557 [Suillus americanus]|nr:hypothetical protein BDR03DRAFT_1017557 [Suillus americanus]
MAHVAVPPSLDKSHPNAHCDSLFSEEESSEGDKPLPQTSTESADGGVGGSYYQEDSPSRRVKRRKTGPPRDSLFSEAESGADGGSDASGNEDVSPAHKVQRRKTGTPKDSPLFSEAELRADASSDASDDGDVSSSHEVPRRKTGPSHDSLFSDVELSTGNGSDASDDQDVSPSREVKKTDPIPARRMQGYMIPEAPRPVICRHSDKTCTEAYHTEPHPSSGLFSPPNSSCPILSDLRIAFTPYGFTCHIHVTLIPPSLFERHMEKHRMIGSRDARKEVVAHLLGSHRITAETGCREPVGELTEPIPGLEIYQAFECPIAGCSRWYTGRDSLRYHYKRDHSLPKAPSSRLLTQRYINRPYYNIVSRGDSLGRRMFILDVQWTPSPSPAHNQPQAVYHHSTVAPPAAVFLIELGWAQYISKFDQPSRSLLRQLVQVRSSAEVDALSGSTKRLENGILLLRKLFARYLIDLQRYRCDTNDEVVQVLLRETRAHFNPFMNVSTYMRYAAPVIQCLSMMLRYTHAAQTGIGKIPSFIIPSNGGEAAAVSMLYDYMVVQGQCNAGMLTQFLHNFGVLLVRHKITSIEVMACPSDVALCLGSLVDNNHFLRANIITLRCTMLQHSWIAILIQWGRIKASGKTSFFPYSLQHFITKPSDATLPRRNAMPTTVSSGDKHTAVGQNASENEEESAEREGLGEGLDGDEDEEEYDEEDLGDRENEMKDMEFQEDLPGTTTYNLNGDSVEELPLASEGFFITEGEGTHQDQDLSVLQLLSDNRGFVHPPDNSNVGFTTPYTRFKGVWAKIAPTARVERTEYGFTFSPNGQAINIPDNSGAFHAVQFSQLGSVARTLIDTFTDTVQTTLSRSLYEEFAKQNLVDDLGCQESIFQQPANQPWLQPMIKTAYDQLVLLGQRSVFHKNGTVNVKAVKALLDKEQDILSLLNVSFQLSCGIPPRAYQMKSLRYNFDPDTGAQRSVFLVWGILAFANPASKQRQGSVKECLWALPGSLATPVLFYLGILRPAFSQILRLVQGGTKEHETYIFVHGVSKHNTGAFWSGADVNASLRKHTPSLPISLSGPLLRSITTGMLRKFFPSLTEPDQLPDSLLDQQAQHRRHTGDTHYGRDFDLPRPLAMTIDRARGYIVTSQALQAIYSLGTPDEASRRVLSNSHFFASRVHELVAFKEARFQVLSVYLKGDISLAQDTLKRAPYMVCAGGVIGDEVLRHVMHVVIFGTSSPSVTTSPPPSGYSVEDAGFAAALIIRAVKEWLLGSHCDLFNPSDVKAAEHFKGCEAAAVIYFQKLRERHPQLWQVLSKEVHCLHGQRRSFLSYIHGAWDGADKAYKTVENLKKHMKDIGSEWVGPPNPPQSIDFHQTFTPVTPSNPPLSWSPSASLTSSTRARLHEFDIAVGINFPDTDSNSANMDENRDCSPGGAFVPLSPLSCHASIAQHGLQDAAADVNSNLLQGGLGSVNDSEAAGAFEAEQAQWRQHFEAEQAQWRQRFEAEQSQWRQHVEASMAAERASWATKQDALTLMVSKLTDVEVRWDQERKAGETALRRCEEKLARRSMEQEAICLKVTEIPDGDDIEPGEVLNANSLFHASEADIGLEEGELGDSDRAVLGAIASDSCKYNSYDKMSLDSSSDRQLYVCICKQTLTHQPDSEIPLTLSTPDFKISKRMSFRADAEKFSERAAIKDIERDDKTSARVNGKYKPCMEICLSSNLLCKTVASLDAHHCDIRYCLKNVHPIVNRTDDALPFRTSCLGEHSLLLAQPPLGLGLSRDDAARIVRMGLDAAVLRPRD